MADQQRHGELIYSDRGKFLDLENGEKGYHALTKRMLSVDQSEEMTELSVFKRLHAMKEEADRKGNKEDAVEIGKGMGAIAATTE